MMDFKLHVLCALSESAPKLDISEQDFPQGVCGTLSDYKGGEFPLPGDAATLLLTDDAALVRALAQNKPECLHMVLIGAFADAAWLEGALEEVWYPEEGREGLRRRYLRLLRVLKQEYDLWFYKSALLTAINTVPDMLWYKRLDGVHTLVNDAFSEIAHKPKSDIHGRDHFYIWDAPRPAEGSADYACAESEEIAISSGRMYVCEEAVKTREGMKQFTTYKTPVYDMFGNVFGTVGVGHDVTDLSNLGAQLSLVVENMPYPICIFSPEWKVMRMNIAFSELASVDSDETLAQFDYHVWKSGLFIPMSDRTEDSVKHMVSRDYQFHLGGKTKYYTLTELEIRNYFGDVSGYICMMQDNTYRRAYEQSILRAANTDMLTGMYNRRYFISRVRGLMGKPFHLLYMDLDRFKSINDNFGHNVGDDVLIRISELIHEFFPHMVAARLGGDEFVVVDEHNDRAYLDERSAAFEEAVQRELSKYHLDAGVSIGIAQTDGSPQDIDRVLRESDERMYEIKKRHHEAGQE